MHQQAAEQANGPVLITDLILVARDREQLGAAAPASARIWRSVAVVSADLNDKADSLVSKDRGEPITNPSMRNISPWER